MTPMGHDRIRQFKFDFDRTGAYAAIARRCAHSCPDPQGSCLDATAVAYSEHDLADTYDCAERNPVAECLSRDAMALAHSRANAGSVRTLWQAVLRRVLGRRRDG